MMLGRYLLDSSFLIDYMRDEPAAVARLARFFEEGDTIYVNDVVVCEIRTGLSESAALAFEALLRPTEFVQPGPETAMRAGEWRGEVRRRGRTLSLADSLIAAVADALGAAVVTRNVRDFEQTPALIETY